MKEWMIVALGLSAATALGACDSRHCVARVAITTDASDSSSVSLKGTFNACPNVFAATASPPSATIGESVTVNVSAGDPDPDDQLTYAWTATTGTFAMPLAASTTYVCSAEGTATITAKVSDGGCTETATIMVTCHPPGADR
jgi:hypothetical protein